MCSLLGNKESYVSLANGQLFPLTLPTIYSLVSMTTVDSRLHQFTPRLFELTSTVGEFRASEVVFPARNGDVEAFMFDQSDLYSVPQPGQSARGQLEVS